MKSGFIKVASVTPNIRVADCDFNTDNIISEIEKVSQSDVKLAVFPELCISGSSAGDLFFETVLIEKVSFCLEKIRFYTEKKQNEILLVIGAPVEIGGNLYNASVVIYKGRFLGAVPKQDNNNQKHFSKYYGNVISSPYGLFGNDIVFRCADLPEFNFAVENYAAIVTAPYSGAEIIGGAERRRAFAEERSRDMLCGYICSGAGYGESTTDMVFSGHSMIVENGAVLNESKPFEYKSITSEIDVFGISSKRKTARCPAFLNSGAVIVDFNMTCTETKLTRFISKTPFIPADKKDYDLTVLIQAHALKKRIEHINARYIVLGVSGGLDSTHAMLVAAKTIDLLSRPRTDILAVTMPCFGTTSRTKSNAEKLASALGTSFKQIDITESVKRHFIDIGHPIDKYDVIYENAQARERTQVLMDIANSCNGLVVGTGDLSELALGWATYSGDHMSMYGINGGLPKTFMREIVRYISEKSDNPALKQVLDDILDTPVSPELLPNTQNQSDDITQKTEDIIGPCELHDFFIYYALEYHFKPGKILKLALYAFEGCYSRDIILKWLKNFYRRFFSQQFKRSCLPDGPQIFGVSLSPRKGLEMPSDGVCNLWLEEVEKIV